MTEAEVVALAPPGTFWHFTLDPNPERADESLGVYRDWRRPDEWSEGVTPHPVLYFRNSQGRYVDYFTVEPEGFCDLYVAVPHG